MVPEKRKRSARKIISVEQIAQTARKPNEGILFALNAHNEAEERLRESEERFRAFFESCIDAILITSPDGKIHAANPEACRIFGMTEPELINTGRDGVVDLSDPRLMPALEERERTGHFRGELNLKRKDGTIFPSEITTALFKDRHGDTRTSMIIRDISERKMVELALKESEHRFQSFMNNSPTIAWMKDEHGRYMYLSKPYEKQFGVQLENWRGKNDFEVWPPEIAVQYHRNDQAVLETEKAIQVIENILGSNGEKGYLLTIKFPFRDASGKKCVGGIGIDITERMKLEDDLQNQYARLKGILESSNSPIFSIDTEYRYTCFNQSYTGFMKSFYGTNVEIGKNVINDFHPERNRKTLKENLDRVLGGESFVREFWEGNDPLTRRYFVIFFNPIKSENGKVIGAAIFANDVTERKRLDDALLESKEFNSALLDYAPNPVLVTNLDTSVRYVNKAFEEITGFTAAESVGLKIPFPWWPQEKISEYEKAVTEGRKKERHVTERCYRRKDGKEVWVTACFSAIKVDGEAKYYLANWSDITERKKAEEALREINEFNAALLENAPNPILVVNPDSSIRYVNPAFESLTGYTRAELMDRKVPYPWWPEQYLEKYKNENMKVLTRKPHAIERLHRKKNNQPFWIALTMQAIKSREETKYYFANWVDITERKQAEDEIKQSREQLRNFNGYLQEKLEEERKFISKEIHDELGQMLTALKIDVSWLAKKVPPQLEPLVQKTRSMISLIDETDKVVKRLSSSLRPPILDDLGLSESLKWLVAQFQTRTGIDCSITIPLQLDLKQRQSVDIFRIVQEALTNVARHSGATRVWVIVRTDADSLIITIRDNGKGITRSQIDNPLSYGLMGMQERAHMIGGSMKIEGLKGKRTTITLTLPLKEQ